MEMIRPHFFSINAQSIDNSHLHGGLRNGNSVPHGFHAYVAELALGLLKLHLDG